MNQAYQKCAAQHLGPWMVEPVWFAQAVAAVKAGTWKAEPPTGLSKEAVAALSSDVVTEISGDSVWILYYIEAGGIARIPMSGQVTKGDSKFGGINSVRARRAVRKAVTDDRVTSILLHIDSPGGTVSGTGDLASEIAKADAVKPVYTYFEDLGASAAYWIGSQSRWIYANPTADIGSIGTMTWVEDTSKKAEMAGVKVTLIATGKYKGQWIDGNPVSEEYIAAVRQEVEDLNEHFLAGVAQGRQMSIERVREVADGRVWIASKAKTLGLIDEVASLDVAMMAITNEVSKMNADTFRQYAAEHPDSVEVKDLIARGHKVGVAEARQQEIERMKGLQAACGARHSLAINSFISGRDPESVKDTVAELDREAAAAQAEITRMKGDLAKAQFNTGTQGAVATILATGDAAALAAAGGSGAAKPQLVKDRYNKPTPASCKALAEWEWANENPPGFSSKESYVAVRTAEFMGQLKTHGRTLVEAN